MDLVFWVAFLVFIGIFLALDLGVFHKSAHIVPPREALAWTAVWVTLAIVFGLAVFVWRGADVGIAWFTGYVIEYSLSVDNVFVFALVLCPSFRVRRRWSISQARVAWSDAPELEDVARERGSYGSRRRELRHLLLVSHCFHHASRPCYIPYLSDTVSWAFVSVPARSSRRSRGASVGSASTAATVATATLLEE